MTTEIIGSHRLVTTSYAPPSRRLQASFCSLYVPSFLNLFHGHGNGHLATNARPPSARAERGPMARVRRSADGRTGATRHRPLSAGRCRTPTRAGRALQPGRPVRTRSCARRSTTAGRAWPTLAPFKTEVHRETAKSIIASNDSPDISFEQSINPYRGCEHGCIYCYARPTHCYLGHSAGLDFETKLYAKINARRAARSASWPTRAMCRSSSRSVPSPTPISRSSASIGITRAMLEVLDRANHPVGIVTKSALVLRDLDMLARHGQSRSRQSRHFRHHARPPHRPQDGAQGRHPAASASRPSAR